MVYVTEKAANIIASFAIDTMGVASPGVFTPSVGNNPYGFDFAHQRFLVVSNAEGGNAGASSATSYTDAVQAVNGAVSDSGTAACWLATDKNGFNAYVSNAGSNNISSYSINPGNGHLALLMASAATPMHPIDIMVSGSNLYVYVISATNNTIEEYSRGANGTLTSIGTLTGLPATDAGLVGY
jgi:6-phosphogluconolactonase (cycloisomerase 2 family)